jgi:ABC-type multidrug transport system ATPase subunit
MQLTITNLSKTYPNGVHALRNISLSIPNGMFGLLGPNGAGKSTLIRILATLQEADSGKIFLGDIDVLKEKDAVRKILGYLPQEFGLYQKVSAETFLDHIAYLKGITRKKEREETVKALLNKVNLYDARKKNLGTYSGGMKQRFGIAQALIGHPKLIIVDEPTAGLDPTERNRFHNLLSEIGENTIVILSTHIVEDVSHLCNNMAIISKGEVLITGHPSQIVDSMEGRIWKKSINKTELPVYMQEHKVISTTLFAGKSVIHVYSEEQPDATFLPVETDLEDVYFTVISDKTNVMAL